MYNRRSSSLLLPCLFLSLLAIGSAGCSRQAGKERALARADAFNASGALDKAEIEYLNTLKDDPTNVRAIVQLALIYTEQGRIGKAPAFLLKAREIQPDDLEIRAKLAAFYLSARKLTEARTEVRYILEHQPSHPEAPVLFAECALQTPEITEAEDYLKKLPTSGTAPVLTSLAVLEMRRHHMLEAEELLKQALTSDPKSAVVHATLGMVYAAQKNLKAAENSFAATWQNSSFRSPRKLIYVRYKLQTGDIEGAKHLLTELITQVPDILPPMLLLAEVTAREKKYDVALTYIDRILGRDPFHYPAMMLSARVHLAKGETAKALSLLEKIKAFQPKNPETHYQFGMTYLAQGDTAQATSSFNQAVELAPNYVEAVMQLAEINLKKGDAITAITALKSLLALRPEQLPVKFLLARAYVNQGDLDAALATYKEVSALSPQDPNFLLPIALIYRQQKNLTEARKVLNKVLALAPDSGPAAEQMVDLELMADNPAEARKHAESLRDKQPNNAGAYLLLAKISLAEKNLSEAEASLLKAIERQPDTLAAYFLLAGIYGQTHQEAKALAQLEQAAQLSPKNPSIPMRIALLHELMKNSRAAREAYEKVLSLEPKFLPALNNLAYLYGEQPDGLDRGLVLAQKARELAPFEPHIADTLGWILYKQAQYQRAKSLLLESAAKSANDALVQFHLGMAQYMMGESESARATLQLALQLNPALPEKNLVTERLAILGTKDTRSGPERRVALEKAVAERKDDPMALTLLGAILEEAGELDQARKKLDAALAINPHNVQAALILIRVQLSRKDTKAALALAQATRKLAPEDPSIGHQLGRIAFEMGEFQWAASLLQESARKLPDNLDVLFDHAKSAYSVGRVADAEQSLLRIQKLQPQFQSADEIDRYLEMIAYAKQPAPDLSAKIDGILKNDPAFVPALMAWGANAEKKLDFPAARQAYEKALAKYPDFTPAKRSLALLAAAATESGPKAYDLAMQAREAYPSDPAIAQALGILAFRKGDFSRASGLLKESLVSLGEDARRTYYLGMAQYRMKDSSARLTLQRSLELGLKDEPASEVRKILAESK